MSSWVDVGDKRRENAETNQDKTGWRPQLHLLCLSLYSGGRGRNSNYSLDERWCSESRIIILRGRVAGSSSSSNSSGRGRNPANPETGRICESCRVGLEMSDRSSLRLVSIRLPLPISAPGWSTSTKPSTPGRIEKNTCSEKISEAVGEFLHWMHRPADNRTAVCNDTVPHAATEAKRRCRLPAEPMRTNSAQ